MLLKYHKESPLRTIARSIPIHPKCSSRIASFRNRCRSALPMQLRLGEELVRALLYSLCLCDASSRPRAHSSHAFPISFRLTEAMTLVRTDFDADANAFWGPQVL